MIFNLHKESWMGKFGSSVKKGATILVIGLSIGTLLSGCGGSSAPQPSTSYTTSQLYAYMTAVQDDSGAVTTTVQLRDSNLITANYVYLAGGETLYSSVDKSPQQYVSYSGNLFGNSLNLSQHLKIMSARDLYMDYQLFGQVLQGLPEYFASDTASSGTSTVRAYVDFERSGNAMTGTSLIDLPGAFQILSPASAGLVPRSSPLTLTWNNVDATTTMALKVAGICDDSKRYNLTLNLGTDTGTATLNSADYFPTIGVANTATCMTAFILQRSKMGGVSSKFAFGSFTGVQQRTVQFNTTP
jgi:hypothetical protein